MTTHLYQKMLCLQDRDVVPVSGEPVLPIMYIILSSNEYKIILRSS